MLLIQLVHVRAAEREAQASFALALGAELYKDPAGNDFVVADNLVAGGIRPHLHRSARVIDVLDIPQGWTPSGIQRVGGWRP